jgi:Zn-dependent peptidase ImmA (M78 family)
MAESSGFAIPDPPEFIPDWASEAAVEWAGLDDFSLLARAEERTGRQIDLRFAPLPDDTWGFHILRGRRAGIFINRRLPERWKRFALFHELYHLLEHRGGETFWERTAMPMSSFERQADLFAWATALKEWDECWEESSV